MESLEELLKQKEEIEKKISEVKKKEYEDKVQKSIAFRKSITPEVKEWLLNNVHHTCASCNNDYNPENSFHNLELNSYSFYDCPRCALDDYLDDDFDYLAEEYEMEIEVHFYKIKKEE